ncbi:MAG: hypothetical protein QOF19_3373 [Alphaproteobacteria bacterium]|jgi:DNA-binding transcriptional MerR regulator|nr:hypothetical protein [Alphaproteobacteria bacterium]
MRDDYAIGALSEATGCKVQTIRYYEQIGLMPSPPRSEGRQRRYASSHIKRLAFIRHARELGFDIEEVRQLLALSDQPDKSCEAVDRIAQHHLAEIGSKIARLSSLEKEVKRMTASCKRGRVAECRVIEVLADHGKCGHKRH